MSDFATLMTEDMRLRVLTLLAVAPCYTAPASVLRSALASHGQLASADRLHTDLAWLAEQGLIQVRVSDGVCVASLLERGHDVATGCATTPGVKRPDPPTNALGETAL